MRDVHTRPGQRAEVYLSDGTRVVLGVASRIRFAAVFGVSRDVDLEGEAYFEVAHDTARPFAVHTWYGTARDIGTKFAVRAYPDMPGATVAVTEGVVALVPHAAANSLLLGVADVGHVSTDGTLRVERGVSIDPYVAWTTGRLVFDRTPVAEALARINRWYGVHVQVGDTVLARAMLTLTVIDRQPFSEALYRISAALDTRVEHRGTTVTLFSNRSSR